MPFFHSRDHANVCIEIMLSVQSSDSFPEIRYKNYAHKTCLPLAGNLNFAARDQLPPSQQQKNVSPVKDNLAAHHDQKT